MTTSNMSSDLTLNIRVLTGGSINYYLFVVRRVWLLGGTRRASSLARDGTGTENILALIENPTKCILTTLEAVVHSLLGPETKLHPSWRHPFLVLKESLHLAYFPVALSQRCLQEHQYQGHGHPHGY